ncbi:GntR family transcriptional regulator [Mycolicibacterium anyangense]|uniref:GntR family transcriptional regulator n=1 Tax=Mycolicibacterium anyangense TaxID=1431246 RepID=A0A6N4WH76_9MYCO|nr:GntR family transcriptional regulator [Mycolicibacterium anyangense]BBZ78551.1 GntR family transcriptional regulator [Mycolicibacterium anyangense]
MPKRYGVKEKDQVVAQILDLLMTGALRSGDRVDRNEIAATLGLSRLPVQEALVQLEHDGILITRYHRGAFVQQFDEASVREHYEVHGLLTGAVSARAAADPRADILASLAPTMTLMREATAPRAYVDGAELFRDIVIAGYAGPRLTATIRSSRSFMPRHFWNDFRESRTHLLPIIEAEYAAICRRDPAAARRACIDRADLMADLLIAELRRRGVFAGLDSV